MQKSNFLIIINRVRRLLFIILYYIIRFSKSFFELADAVMLETDNTRKHYGNRKRDENGF